ncbi:MAG: hypothetical protein HZB95_03760 [Nitrosomonadales bacterium]|nr:hypothetical protein [Nitrosomonadales bacterium]
MINLTKDMAIIVDDAQLSIAIEDAIRATHLVLLSTYAPLQERVSPDLITATKNNRLKALAFCRYFPEYSPTLDRAWVNTVFSAVHDHTGGEVTKNHSQIMTSIGLSGDIPNTLAREVWRGLRIFLIALWTKKAILLPMSFSLPASKYRSDISKQLYTELLAILRSPFIDEKLAVPDISGFIKTTGWRNYDWYAWRPILASDWHSVEDINDGDLAALFSELAKRKSGESELPAYPLSPRAFLGPILSAIPDRCHFDTAKLSIYHPLVQTPAKLEEELTENNYLTSYPEIKEVWMRYQQRYITYLVEVKKIKSPKAEQQTLGRLNEYLFSVLPKEGEKPPLPLEFRRKHLEGIGVTPMRRVLYKRDRVTAIERFFDYLENISNDEEELRGFVNPILSIDKPRERRPRGTRKKTFRINDYRLFYELIHAIGEFSWYLAQKIGEGTAPESWYSILKDKTKNTVLNTEDFGFVPIIRFTKMDGTPVSFKLLWLPITVVPTKYVQLNHSPQRLLPIINLHGIHQVIVGSETGLRHIHIRWLDKRSFKAQPVDPAYSSFDLLVNTDKVTYEWIRPTAMTVLKALERQIESQSWISAPHFETELYYDYHEQSDFGKICPVFMRYDDAQTYDASALSLFFHNIIYFFNQIKLSLGQATTDPMPYEVTSLSFKVKEDFKQAMLYRSEFDTKYTPHGLRATVVSVHAPILPPHIIGKYITGHTSENMVRYYTVVDSDYMEVVKAFNRERSGHSEYRQGKVLSIDAGRENSSLKRDLATSPISDVLRDYGAFSSSNEEASGEIKSGMSIIRGIALEEIRINSTHICPVGNECPPEIAIGIGRRACGQCPYSIKTIDHLPRILAHCRALSRKLDKAKIQLQLVGDRNASEEVLETLEDEILFIAGELSAWTLTAEVLAKNVEELKDRTLVNNPEMLSKDFKKCLVPDSELENLLIQCEEAVAYPELADLPLLADIAMVRPRILAMTGSMEELFAPTDQYQLVDNFRGLIRGICIATGMRPKELAEHMEKALVAPTPILKSLELLHD